VHLQEKRIRKCLYVGVGRYNSVPGSGNGTSAHECKGYAKCSGMHTATVGSGVGTGVVAHVRKEDYLGISMC